MCTFCNVVTRDVEADVVFEDDISIAFLDIRPVFPGHTLLIPREHHATFPDLPDHLIAPFFLNARTLARAVPDALGADGSFVAMNNRISQSVPHLHVHVVPRRKGDGLRGFFWPRHKYDSDDERVRIAAAIRRQISGAE